MTRIGFCALLMAVLARAGVVAPALLGRRPDIGFRVAVAAAFLALFVANTFLTARRIGDSDGAADRVWVLGAVGLALAGALLSLI